MLYYIIAFYILAFAYFCAVMLYLIRKSSGIKILLFNSVLGLFLLSLLKITSVYTSLAVNINIVSVLSSLILGAPGVGAYFLINFLFL